MGGPGPGLTVGIRQVDITLFEAEEEPRKEWLRNGVRRTTFGESDGMYLYRSSDSFADKYALEALLTSASASTSALG